MGVLWSAFILCAIVVAISFVGRLLEKEKPPIIIYGTVQPGFEEVLEAFRANFESGDVEPREGGSAFAAYYKGKQVVNIWGGYADYESSQPWRENTMAIIFSATKGMAALCLAMLVDRGQLDYDQKVVHYWPEFGQNGKENVTVRQLLNHEAGVLTIDAVVNMDLLKDYDELGRGLARSSPIWEPGTTHGYHGLTFGLYASQLLSRVDPKKRKLGEYFKDEVAEPFGIEVYIGLPKELNYRVARYFTDKLNWDGMRSFIKSLFHPTNRAITMSMIGKSMSKDSAFSQLMKNAKNISNFYQFNDPMIREIEYPSASGIGTAEALAKVYGIIANGGKTLEGKRLLSDHVIQMIDEAGTRGNDEVFGVPTRFSLGYARQFYQNRDMLGHAGYGGNNGYADLHNNLGVGYVTRYASQYKRGIDPRFISVTDALYRALEKLER